MGLIKSMFEIYSDNRKKTETHKILNITMATKKETQDYTLYAWKIKK